MKRENILTIVYLTKGINTCVIKCKKKNSKFDFFSCNIANPILGLNGWHMIITVVLIAFTGDCSIILPEKTFCMDTRICLLKGLLTYVDEHNNSTNISD